MMLFGALLVLPLVFCSLSALCRAVRQSRRAGALCDCRVRSVSGVSGGLVALCRAWWRVAANTQVAIAYLAVLVPSLEDPVIKASAVIGFIIVTTIINLVGMRTSVGALGVMTVMKLVPLIALIIFGLATPRSRRSALRCRASASSKASCC